MNWKERVKPDNKAEAGCYKFVFLLAILSLIVISGSFFKANFNSLFRALLIFVILLSAGFSIGNEVHKNYQLSRLRAFSISFVLVAILALMFVALLIGATVLLIRLPFLRERGFQLIWFALLCLFLWGIARQEPSIKRLVFTRILHLPAKVEDDSISKDNSQ